MGFWDNVVDGFKSGRAGKGPNYVRKQRERRLAQVAIGEAQLADFLSRWQAQYDQKVKAERARGNRNLPQVVIEDGFFDGQRAVVKFNDRGHEGRVDIYYGGAGSNPMQTPTENYHGHIVVVDGSVTEWLTPGPRDQRERLV